MQKYITEILEEINADPTKLDNYKGDTALTIIFTHAFLKDKKFLLPEGAPPFKQDAAPIGMTPSNLRQELRRFYIFQRADLSNLRREELFIGLLEGLHPKEAELMVAIKDQTLHKMYKKITHKRVAEAGFVPHPLVKKPVKNTG